MITGGGSSCTNETTYAVGPWVGTGANFTVVDTPGFQDTDQVKIGYLFLHESNCLWGF